MEPECQASDAWRQALWQEISLALAIGRDAEEVLTAISTGRNECPVIDECARDAMKQISDATSIGVLIWLPLAAHRVYETSLFWQTQAVMANISEGAGLQALLPILALHASRVSFQWELIAQLAARSGLPDLLDLLTEAAEQRCRVSRTVEAACLVQWPEGE